MTEVTSGTQPDASMTDTSVADTSMAEVRITVDHVYLPLDETEKTVRIDWAVTSVSTTRVSRGTELQVPTDLALYLDKRKQAEIL
jgi:hypothetical protein